MRYLKLRRGSEEVPVEVPWEELFGAIPPSLGVSIVLFPDVSFCEKFKRLWDWGFIPFGSRGRSSNHVYLETLASKRIRRCTRHCVYQRWH